MRRLRVEGVDVAVGEHRGHDEVLEALHAPLHARLVVVRVRVRVRARVRARVRVRVRGRARARVRVRVRVRARARVRVRVRVRGSMRITSSNEPHGVAHAPASRAIAQRWSDPLDAFQ